MCGRFADYIPRKELADFLDLDDVQIDLPLRYNVAPTQRVRVVGETREGGRKVAALRCGLVPASARDASKGYINARAETITQRAS
ncbi:MAG: SOS response-associated peptidase [Acidobacteria bacterium]|nr:SOS response-associated peptidase [Acidobacteriota bacterium]